MIFNSICLFVCFVTVATSWWGNAGQLLPPRTPVREQDQSVLALPPQEHEALRQVGVFVASTVYIDPLLQEAMTAAVGYWTNKLKWSPPVLQVPLDRTRPAQTTFECAVVSAALPPNLVDQLARLGERAAVPFFCPLTGLL